MAQKGYIKNSLTKDLGAPEMANMFQGIFGSSGIMSLYENLACVKVDNNTVRMSAGAYNLSGHLLGIAKGTTEDLTIDSGTSGQNRNDLVVAEFVRNGGGLGVDTLHFAVVKGISTSGTAADPALTQQDINAAGVTRQEALYRVKVTGTEITAVEKVAGSVSNLNLVQSGVSALEARTQGLVVYDINIPAGQTKTLTVSKPGHFYIQARMKLSSQTVGCYIANTDSIGADRWSIVQITPASNVVIGKTAGTLTIQSAASGDVNAVIVSLSGATIAVS